MAYQKLSFPLIVLSTALLVQLAAGPEPLFHVCTIDEKFTTNSEYDKNLRILLRDLYYKTSATGYQYEYVTGKDNETVYGSALCRGDVSQADCRACVFEATIGIGQICPNNVGANVYYEQCSLEYSNSNTFGDPISTGYYLKSDYNTSIRTSHSSLADIKKLFNVLSDHKLHYIDHFDMDYQKLSFSLIVLYIALFFQLATAAQPFFHTCTIYKNFTANSEYDKNLKILLRGLYYETPLTGYEYESVIGKNDSIYSSALCRGDVLRADCRTCVYEAVHGIRQNCPYNIVANVWYEHCYLEYSNFNSFGYPLSTRHFFRSEYSISTPISSLAKAV